MTVELEAIESILSEELTCVRTWRDSYTVGSADWGRWQAQYQMLVRVAARIRARVTPPPREAWR